MGKTTYKLHYFDARGRPESIRWILHYAGQDFVDHRIQHPEWAALKPSTPFGQLPYLEVEEFGKTETLGQTQAIARYFARQHGLAGKTPMEEAQVDAIVLYVTDAIKGLFEWYQALRTSNPNAQTMIADYLSKGVVPFLQKFESRLTTTGDSQTAFFVGNQLTWADLEVIAFLDELVRQDANILSSYPALSSLSTRVHNLKGIKEWLASRPETRF